MWARLLPLISLLIFSDITAHKKLKQVVILSRHNVRTPLAKNLGQITPKSWPNWKEKSGYLTQKGAMLEGFMGVYFAARLREQGLLTNDCPTEQEMYIYANVKQRTRASAQAFVDKGFPNCNITIHHNDSDKMDPIFNPVIHNDTEIFRQIALEEMHARLKSLHLNSSYDDLGNILDFKESEMCMKQKVCDLNNDINKIINVETGLKPNINGPLKIGNSAIDAFIMEYYEGMKNVAWGCLTDSDWQRIMHISRGYHNVIFNTTLIAKDISKPLLNYMSEIFLNNSYFPKVILLMGHDANIYTILKGMDFLPYLLEDQHEITPVGGKIVFERWEDNNGKDYLKINYIYQSRSQMRNGEVLTLKRPPRSTLLKLKGCKTDEDGLCPWEDFIKLLKNFRY
ncbi:histidine phosphatase superfamily (branch 2) domain-containing protein [Phthorimaea operculella]|nr:histidine phosphatase superfamily (branch 2) domain-containing protein [Phthorimaea operculella]